MLNIQIISNKRVIKSNDFTIRYSTYQIIYKTDWTI